MPAAVAHRGAAVAPPASRVPAVGAAAGAAAARARTRAGTGITSPRTPMGTRAKTGQKLIKKETTLNGRFILTVTAKGKLKK